MFFCDFWKFFKSTFFTDPLRMATSGSSGLYLKTYQNGINWVNNSDFNANTEHIFACCNNFGRRHPEYSNLSLGDIQEKCLWWGSVIAWKYNIVLWL